MKTLVISISEEDEAFLKQLLDKIGANYWEEEETKVPPTFQVSPEKLLEWDTLASKVVKGEEQLISWEDAKAAILKNGTK